MNQAGNGMVMLRAINDRIVARNVGSGLTRAMEMRASVIVACIAREDEELKRGNRARRLE